MISISSDRMVSIWILRSIWYIFQSRRIDLFYISVQNSSALYCKRHASIILLIWVIWQQSKFATVVFCVIISSIINIRTIPATYSQGKWFAQSTLLVPKKDQWAAKFVFFSQWSAELFRSRSWSRSSAGPYSIDYCYLTNNNCFDLSKDRNMLDSFPRVSLGPFRAA